MNKVTYTTIRPLSSLNLLSQEEIFQLSNPRDELYQLFRNCALAILNTDAVEDDVETTLKKFEDFDIRFKPQARGVMLEIFNAPAQSFVDGKIIRGIQENLFSVLRDIIYTDFKILVDEESDTNLITDKVFRILRNASALRAGVSPNLVVCWGGHSIPREEYDYAKHVGYELGLRGLDIITGCGIGAMKGPMKGAAVGHAKQQNHNGRYIGISEPGIIASESPNAIVNELIIMPDIEKRLEAFVRLGHVIIVFPGGAGTAEEIMYLLSILMHPDNQHSIPVFFAGSEKCREYWQQMDDFLKQCLGEEVTQHYQIIIGEPDKIGNATREAANNVHEDRYASQDAFYFNWQLYIDPSLQFPFIPTHENMAKLKLDPDLPKHELACQIRSAFSGIVAGNVKTFGLREVAEHGPYVIDGEPQILAAIDALLKQFVEQGRMKLGQATESYKPCYIIAEH